jgi:FkbM family methyltransferase
MLVRMPRNESVLRETGPYLSGINLLDRHKTAVQRAIRREGLAGYEVETQATLLTLVQLSRRPAEFFDVGAHIGLYTAMISTVYPPEWVHCTAFEPTPGTADICREVMTRNVLDVTLERLALGAEEGTATLFVSDKAETSNSLSEGFRNSSASVTVRLTTLDAYCERAGRAPTVMKIDVETYEAYVLQGAMGMLREARPSFVCELLPSAAPGPTEHVLSEIEALGYHVHRWEPDTTGWVSADLADVMTQRSGTHRDWLFTPEPLEPAFHGALAAWLDAIAECTPAHTVFIPGGAPLPVGWGVPYRVGVGVS